jgi:hypothetical protein
VLKERRKRSGSWEQDRRREEELENDADDALNED